MARTDQKFPGPAALAKEFGIFADRTRLAILKLLMQGVQCNCVIGDRLGLPMNLISHHLKVLRDAGLVTFTRDDQDARWIYYSVNAAKVAEFQSLFGTFLNPARIQERSPSCGPREIRAAAVAASCSTRPVGGRRAIRAGRLRAGSRRTERATAGRDHAAAEMRREGEKRT